jgi:hypothetical protein
MLKLPGDRLELDIGFGLARLRISDQARHGQARHDQARKHA